MENAIATAPTYFPFGNRYDKIDKRYKFSRRTDLRTLGADYPIHENQNIRIYYDDRKVHLHQRRQSKLDSTPSNVERMFPGDSLPDVILLTIFKYMHPLDLINGISMVSKRWNKLSNAPSNYRSVRVVIDGDSVRSGSARAFLQRGAMCIKQLCLDYETEISPGCLADVLPECMPSVTLLDIGFVADIRSNIDALLRCFPNVEILNMEHVAGVDRESVEKIFSRDSFPRLRRFYIGPMWEIRGGAIRKLLSWERRLEVLLIRGISDISFVGIECSPFISTLTELYLHCGFLTQPSYSPIGMLKNLKKLSINSTIGTPGEELLHLKTLCNLEHLHMDCCGQDCDFSPMSIAEFFRLPDENPSDYFPYRLKYLNFSNCYEVNGESVPVIVKSCPDLESLNIRCNEFMGEEAFSLIIKNLKKLRFLDVSEMGEMTCDALRNLSNDDLPQLQFLAIHRTQVSHRILEKLNKKRPKLIITKRMNHFINWSRQDGKTHISKEFDGDVNAVLNDLSEMEGFCCMGRVSRYPWPENAWMYDMGV
ncbi:putative F-box/LRR-repeat protein C02F5.7 [Toxocara canis]|uniref:Putative F-box/LRR-repeat protein C02F5.7 n=1 Tax=Toxocara canis TaxID=6265 RepID=A0A0B2VCW6_TOXCA|nr:putative F-box/LRR-repeat protein C02F5.7 [Toxocara canis]